MKHLLSTAAVIVLAQLGIAQAMACTPTIPTVEKGKLTVAAYDYPPFSVTGPGTKIGGIDADIVARAAKENCLEVAPMIMDPAATIQAVITGKADVAIGSWNRTEKRAAVLDISGPTYLDPMGIFSKEGFDSVEALKGKTVGTVTGYLWVGELQKLFGPSLKLYPTPIALAQDLEAGRIDAGVDGYNSGIFLQKTTGGYKGVVIVLSKPDERVQASVQPAQAGILYTKGNAALGKALDLSITQQHADGSIVKALQAAGFDAKVGDVGEPRMVK
ncbi:polar amino acid transport system substrate-binding protein [Angulomicrobium tetraedrale]|uniref:Polar amino acid transport system substrate-binding protein n=1 Tax=Ancylobacter tetraedralis TaxID=217068 RepID=A0A839ZFH1_9HYPH|nr:transporter substrate-binding domain-containing protein [Ancylobacter tetraedralis]MBB3773428.1 polar amino acid transport system substrate-binding protein [Ancylobacter tetraedralis]